MRVTVLIAALGLSASCATSVPKDAPETVSEVDLDRYAGLWFDVGHFPASFQDDCVCSTAEYTRESATTVAVRNTCLEASGDLRDIDGDARVEEPPARFSVQFFPLFRAPYWIVALDSEYRWAVVSEPKREYLWILARTPALEEDVRAQIEGDLAARGFDMSRLRRPPADCGARFQVAHATASR